MLKGGVNLRFFFNSPRYSEDMDLDVVAGNVTTWRRMATRYCGTDAFIRNLRTYGIEDIDINDPEKSQKPTLKQLSAFVLV